MTIPQVLHLKSFVPFLLAQARGPQVEAGELLLWLGIGAVLIVGISVGAYLVHRAAIRRQSNSHPGLFDALCNVHHLDRGQRALLRQVVRARTMPYPGQVFTEPKWTNPQAIPTSLHGKVAELGKIHKKLFA